MQIDRSTSNVKTWLHGFENSPSPIGDNAGIPPYSAFTGLLAPLMPAGVRVSDGRSVPRRRIPVRLDRGVLDDSEREGLQRDWAAVQE